MYGADTRNLQVVVVINKRFDPVHITVHFLNVTAIVVYHSRLARGTTSTWEIGSYIRQKQYLAKYWKFYNSLLPTGP